MKSRTLGIVLCLCLLAAPGLAAEFQPMGFKSLSMGGAGVAAANGAYAAYFNPALLAGGKDVVQVALSASMGAREYNLAESVDELSEVDIDNTMDRLSNLTPAQILAGALSDPQLRQDLITVQAELYDLSGGNGLQLMPGVSLGVQVGGLGFGVYGVSEATAYAVIDPNRLDIIVQEPISGVYFQYNPVTDALTVSSAAAYQASSIEYAADNGYHYIQLNGLAYAEIPVACGHAFEGDFGRLALGASAKLMPGATFRKKIMVDTESGEIDDELDNAREDSLAFGVDAGALYSPSMVKNLTVGLVAKNLNTPAFSAKTGPDVELDPQLRAGATLTFLDERLTVALDYDLTSNETFLPGYDSQMVGGGVAFEPVSWFSVRGGVMKNIQEDEEGTIFTAGLGFGAKWFQLDVAGQVSDKWGTYDEYDIPRYTRVQVSLVSKWF
ncbi:MAG: conjugal transfer protein TraF [Deltaproteobacteria bacterium]|nr:conjugal transfer protein TraF [Deltaproteobacteria bacterium]